MDVFKRKANAISNWVKLNRIYMILGDIKQIENIEYIFNNRDKHRM